MKIRNHDSKKLRGSWKFTQDFRDQGTRIRCSWTTSEVIQEHLILIPWFAKSFLGLSKW